MLKGFVLFSTLVYYTYSFPLGYILMHLKAIPKFNSLPFFVKVPIYLSVGLSGVVILFSFVGRIVFNLYLITILFILIFVCFLVILRRQGILQRKTIFNLQLIDWKKNIPPFLLFLTVLFYFVTAVDYLNWPSPGDATKHGVYVSFINEFQKIPVTS